MSIDRDIETLPDCCKRSLKEIDDALVIGKIGGGLMVLSPIIVMIGKPTDVAQEVGASKAGEKLGEAYSGSDLPDAQTQLDAFEAVTKKTVRRISGAEVLKHKGGVLHKFWKEMFDRFS